MELLEKIMEILIKEARNPAGIWKRHLQDKISQRYHHNITIVYSWISSTSVLSWKEKSKYQKSDLRVDKNM
jgi:hypothetical protein